MANTRKKKVLKWIFIIVAALALIFVLLVGALVYAASKMSSGIMMVTVETVGTGDLQEKITANGTLDSEKKVAVFSKVNAYVDQVYVQNGDEVKAGECVVSFQRESAEDALTQATLQQTKSTAAYQKTMTNNSESSSKLNEANVNLDVLKQQITDWEANIKKMEEQLEDSMRNTSNGYAAQIFELTTRIERLQKELATLDPTSEAYAAKKKELEEAQEQLSQVQYLQQISGNSDAYADLKRKIQKAQEELAEFKAYEAEMKGQKTSSESTMLDQYDRAQLEADNTLAGIAYEKAEEEYQRVLSGITAEFDGVVTGCTVLPGSSVVPGVQVLTIESNKEVKVIISVPQVNMDKIAVGQKAEIKFNSCKYEGTVTKISKAAFSTGTGAPLINVDIHIENPDDNIILGVDTKVEVFCRKAENALLIPVEAINMDRDGDYVFVLGADNIVEKRYIVCGITEDMMTEVVEGLSTGEQVVTESMMELTDGMKVTPMPQ